MVVVFGSLNVDMVMKVDTMPCSGETALCPRYLIGAGGKGANQALAAAKAGADVKFFGAVGEDEFAERVLASLKTASVDITNVHVVSGAATGCAMVCVDAAGENIIIVASGANLKIKEENVPDALLQNGTTLVLQMETPLEENEKLIKRAKARGARVVLNLAPAKTIQEDILKAIDILVVNEAEALSLALQLKHKVISPLETAKHIATVYGIVCIVTLGKEGAVACTPQNTFKVDALKIKPVDTTGAGDAFVGVLAASLDAGLDLPESLQRASVASGLSCLQDGAQSSLPSAAEIEARLKNESCIKSQIVL